jgi:hypothetical protein
MSLRTQIACLSLFALGLASAGALGFGVSSHAAVSQTMTGSVMDGDLLTSLAFSDGSEVGSTDFPANLLASAIRARSSGP